MSQAILSFNLPEDKSEFNSAWNGSAYLAVLQDVDNELRSLVKYNGDLSEDTRKAFDKVRDMLRENCVDQNIALWPDM